MPAIEELEPRLLFGHFASILKIPRESGNEAAARDFVIGWAKERGFEYKIDSVGNVVVRVPATPGRENAPTVVLQGHLDMVCEKRPESDHDFAKDPIPAYADGDVLRTRGTTLGADNGIGLAASMAAAEDPDCVHGPLELLFTVDEETGLTGAFNFDASNIQGRILLNLDSEEEGTLYVGCAGGGDTSISLPLQALKAHDDWKVVGVKVSGLKGGHSGLDIAGGRGNALKLLARAIYHGTGGSGFLLGCLEGGNKRNAIPRDAHACVFLPTGSAGSFTEAVSRFLDVARDELKDTDPGVDITVDQDATCDLEPVTQEASATALRLLLALPHGVLAMSRDIPGMVETSTNLAVARRDGNKLEVLCNTRSSVDSALEAVRLSIRAAGELAGGEVTTSGKYPGWRPNMESALLGIAREVWKDTTGSEPNVTAIHAGLECGVIGEKVRGMDMISFGPTITGAHSPDEQVSIGSTARFYEYLKAVLARLSA